MRRCARTAPLVQRLETAHDDSARGSQITFAQGFSTAGLTYACHSAIVSGEGALTLQHTCWRSDHVRCLFISHIAKFAPPRRRELAMPYIVHIRQLATADVRSRVEDSEWDSDERLWTHGSRACDCTRALLFAQEQEIAACPCGMSGYAIPA